MQQAAEPVIATGKPDPKIANNLDGRFWEVKAGVYLKDEVEGFS